MRPIKLLNLLARNAKRGEFRAEGNTIFLYDVIVGSDAEAEFWGGVSPEAFAKQLAGMSGTVHLRINSPGGEVFAARAMAQAMREYEGEIIAHVDGVAASAASFVAIAADRVLMAEGSFFMIHNAWTLALGNAAELRATAALLEKIDVSLAESYAAKAGTPAAEFAALMDAESWLTAVEAVDLGLADEIAGAQAEKARAAGRWDLSAYERPPTVADTAAPTPAVEPEPEPEPANPVREAEPTQDPVADVTAQNERRARIAAARLLQTAA